jgi:hypothetical protein
MRSTKCGGHIFKCNGFFSRGGFNKTFYIFTFWHPITVLMQAAAFEMLKVSGLLCSRYGTAIERARRYFVLAESGDELTSENRSEELVKQLTPAVVGGSSPA